MKRSTAHSITIAMMFSSMNIVAAADLPAAAFDCRALEDSEKRLDCYDSLVDQYLVNIGAGPTKIESGKDAGSVTKTDDTLVATAPEQQNEPVIESADKRAEISPEALFGKNSDDFRESVQSATGTREISELTATITKLAYTAAGKVVLTLSNGQVWVQVDTEKARLSKNNSVVIRRAALGSFLLSKSGSKRSIRVRRVT